MAQYKILSVFYFRTMADPVIMQCFNFEQLPVLDIRSKEHFGQERDFESDSKFSRLNVCSRELRNPKNNKHYALL